MHTFFSNTFSGRLYHSLFAIVALSGLLYIAIKSWATILLLIFAVVLTVGLVGASKKLHTITRLPYIVAMFSIVLVLFGVIGVFFSYFIPAVVQEVSQADDLIAQAAMTLETITSRVSTNTELTEQLNPQQLIQTLQDRGGSILTGVQSVFTSTFSVLFNVLLMLVIVVYLAIAPQQYTEGVINLFPKSNQAKVGTLLATANNSLLWWLLARLSSMLVVGLLTYIGLLILGIPLAFSLAVLTGLLSFIPNLGPILSFIPAGLIALTIGWASAISVALLFVIVQVIESNAITPIIEKKMVSSPPALLLISQVIFGSVFGFIGLLLAAPLVAVSVGVLATRDSEIN